MSQRLVKSRCLHEHIAVQIPRHGALLLLPWFVLLCSARLWWGRRLSPWQATLLLDSLSIYALYFPAGDCRSHSSRFGESIMG